MPGHYGKAKGKGKLKKKEGKGKLRRITNKNIHTAVKQWCTDREEAIKIYGHISSWNTSKVTRMQSLFRESVKF